MFKWNTGWKGSYLYGQKSVVKGWQNTLAFILLNHLHLWGRVKQGAHSSAQTSGNSTLIIT